jgi:SAM-dependent methyltransferase
LLLKSEPSATQVVPLLIKLFSPKSVVDIGCGLGSWLSVFQQHQVANVLGVDQPKYINLKHLTISSENFRAHDLTQPLQLPQKYDLATCLEVAEHLPESAADTLIQSLVGASDIVVFSAAIPSQGGIHHVNEQWASYWVKRFAQHAYEAIDCIRPHIWNNNQVEMWYRQNLLVFIKQERLAQNNQYQQLKTQYAHHPLDVVHPELWKKNMANHENQVAILERHIAYLKQENMGVKNALNNLMKGLKRKLFFWQ